VEKCTAISRNVEESFRKFVYLDPQVNDLQNFIGSSLTSNTSLVKFSRTFNQ